MDGQTDKWTGPLLIASASGVDNCTHCTHRRSRVTTGCVESGQPFKKVCGAEGAPGDQGKVRELGPSSAGADSGEGANSGPREVGCCNLPRGTLDLPAPLGRA